MSDYDKIAEGIKGIALTPDTNITAIVTAVDLNSMDCDVDPPGMAPILGVRLRAAEGVTDGVVEVPKVYSSVIVSMIGNSDEEYLVVACSEVDKVVINNGDNGGLVKAGPLLDGLEKNNKILTGILNLIMGTPINEPGSGSPSALQTALRSKLAGLPVGDFGNIENEKVTH